MLALPPAEREAEPQAHTLMLAEVDAQGEDEEVALLLWLPEVEPLRLPSSDPVGVKVAVRLLEAQLVAHAERVRSLRDDDGETDPVKARLGVPVERALAEALFEARAEFEVEAEGEVEEVMVPLLDGLPVGEREKKALPVPLLLGRGDAELLGEPVKAAVAVMEEEEVMEGEPDWVRVLAAVAEVQGDPEREEKALPELVGLARVDVVPLAEPVAKPEVVAEDETLGEKVAMAVAEGGAEALEEPVAKLAVDVALGHGVTVPLTVADTNGVLEMEPVALKEGDSSGDMDTEPHLEAVPVTRPVFDTVSVARGLSLTLPEKLGEMLLLSVAAREPEKDGELELLPHSHAVEDALTDGPFLVFVDVGQTVAEPLGVPLFVEVESEDEEYELEAEKVEDTVGVEVPEADPVAEVLLWAEVLP